MSGRAVLAAVAIASAVGAVLYYASRVPVAYVECGPGFFARGPRCLPRDPCPAPLASTARGCDAPAVRVRVPAQRLVIGPSDWEAEGRVTPRTVEVAAFDLDAFEVTIGAFDTAAISDLARAASGMTRDEARAFCEVRGGRLPTEDEWLAAAAGDAARRYPWGDTGAVCRRAAWGLDRGPCATGASGPDTVGAHPDGDSPLHIHDLAGNVAEWVEPHGGVGAPAIARGGSWRSALASDLRTWASSPSPSKENGSGRRADVGFRCAYDAVPAQPAPAQAPAHPPDAPHDPP